MARVFVTIEMRPTPALTTPPLGGVGDRCDRSCEAECRIDNIIRKYGEILPQALAAQQMDIDMSDVPDDPIDKMAYIKGLKDRLAERGLSPLGEVIDVEKFKAAFPAEKSVEKKEGKDESLEDK